MVEGDVHSVINVGGLIHFELLLHHLQLVSFIVRRENQRAWHFANVSLTIHMTAFLCINGSF